MICIFLAVTDFYHRFQSGKFLEGNRQLYVGKVTIRLNRCFPLKLFLCKVKINMAK